MPASERFDITGKVALVTGAGRGIGRAYALGLAAAGAAVAVLDVRAEAAEQVAAEVRALDRRSIAIGCDITDGDAVREAIAAVAAEYGRLDIAVNNAGIYRHGLDEELSDDDWRSTIEVNLTGVWLCATAEMQQMTAQSPQGGTIINTASISSIRSISNGPYDAAKAGVVHLTVSLARQWGRHGITVNALSPGFVVEGFGGARDAAEQEHINSLTPVGRGLEHDDLVGPLLFLASPAGSYITGQNLVVDGGHTLSTWAYPTEALSRKASS